MDRGRFLRPRAIGFMWQNELMRKKRGLAMSRRTFATLVVAVAVTLAVDFSASVSFGQHGYFLRRWRIGRILIVPHRPPMPFIRPDIPFLPYEYYNQRGIAAGSHKPLGSSEIVNSLQARGFRDISPPKNRGSTYITEATGPGGERVRLVINGKSGGIDGVRAIGFDDRR
jgi:hypothetical protein